MSRIREWRTFGKELKNTRSLPSEKHFWMAEGPVRSRKPLTVGSGDEVGSTRCRDWFPWGSPVGF